jgi:transposase-like protein
MRGKSKCPGCGRPMQKDRIASERGDLSAHLFKCDDCKLYFIVEEGVSLFAKLHEVALAG